jgi:predicted DNA-binding transcriptional regulator YafY
MKMGCNVSISYHSFAKDSESTREIQPFGFQLIDGQEYLDSYCYESKDFRMFRLDRITNVIKMGPAEKMLKEAGNVSSVLHFSVKLSSHFRRAAEVLNIKISSIDSRSEEFESTAFNNEWIIRTICSLNSAARLTKPADLRKEVVIRANRALALYV